MVNGPVGRGAMLRESYAPTRADFPFTLSRGSTEEHPMAIARSDDGGGNSIRKRVVRKQPDPYPADQHNP